MITRKNTGSPAIAAFGNIIIMLLLCFFLSCFFISTDKPVYAEESTSDQYSYGYTLDDGYNVQISYHYYILYLSGVYFAYDVTFDNAFYSSVENKKELINSVKDTFLKNGFSLDVDIDNGKMTAYLSYDSLTDYYISQGENGYSIGEPSVPVKKTLFYTDYSNTFQTVFTGLKTEGKFVNRIYNACVDAGIEDENILLSYVYGTPYGENLITSSADKISYSASEHMYYHIFNMKVSERERFITVNQHSPNSSGWYLIAIIAGIVVLAIPLTVLVIKKKRRQ